MGPFREFDCDGCAQHIVHVGDSHKPESRPDLCGGCIIIGPANYVVAMLHFDQLDAEERDAAAVAITKLREQWGDAVADNPTPWPLPA